MAFLGKFKGGYQDLWKAIIRPPRDEYDVKDLGPQEFRLKGKVYRRTDLQIKNKRNMTLECSFFEPTKRLAPELPCVVYLHGNCSSRMEALQAVEVLLPANITLFCLDFAGCGKSEGEYISLGWYERDDVEAVIDYLRNSGKVSTIGLWGRSMGAVTSLMHADRDPSIGGIVLDSPFSDLRLLAEELVKNHTKIPKLIVSGAMGLIRKTIQGKAKFDINDLVPMNHVAAGFVPAMFVAGKDDNFIDCHHAKDLHQKYAGDKNLVIVDGDHNSARPSFLMDSISIFFHNTLLVDMLPKEEEKSSDKEKSRSKHKESEKLKSLDKDKDKAPMGGGLGFKESYSKSNGVPFESKKIGNDDEVHNILEEVDEEELRKAIEESMVNGFIVDVKVDGGPEEEKVKSEELKEKDIKNEEDKSEDPIIDKIPFDMPEENLRVESQN